MEEKLNIKNQNAKIKPRRCRIWPWWGAKKGLYVLFIIFS